MHVSYSFRVASLPFFLSVSINSVAMKLRGHCVCYYEASIMTTYTRLLNEAKCSKSHPSRYAT